MSETTKMGYGYQDDTSESLQTKSGGKFGLNQNAFLTKFEFQPKTDKSGNSIAVSVKVGDRDYMAWLSEVTRVYDNDNNEISDVNSDEYIKGYNDQQIQLGAVVAHYLKAFVDEAAIKTALDTAKPQSFTDWANVMTTLLPAGFHKMPIDIALQYQWKIKGDNNRTFLELPKNMKGGYFICKAQIGVYTEDRSGGKLVYKNNAGLEHPFTRGESFMNSAKANQQIENEGDSGNGAAIAGTANQTPAKSSNW
jgi:hypothetical protein